MSGRPRLLDLFCGAGGASAGYVLAGFDVVGVDLAPQPRYPWKFHQASALDFPLDGFDLIHASPPCQLYTTATALARSRGKQYPDLVAPTRERLLASGTPWVIENVPGAPLIDPIMLCGAMFNLNVYRHRLFESSFTITPPPHPKHTAKAAGQFYAPRAGEFATVTGQGAGHDLVAAIGAMGSGWWMSGHELSESIPPAYSLFVGRAFIEQARHDLSAEIVTAAPHASADDDDQQRHDLHTEIVTRLPNPADTRRARDRELAAKRARRYRARQRGENVPLLKPGPKQGRDSITRERRLWEAAELAQMRMVVADLRRTLGDQQKNDGHI